VNMASVLVIGGDGQVGRTLRGRPRDTALDVGFLGRDALDITDATLVDDAIAAHGPDVVVNCAAYSNVDGAETDTDQAFAVNRDGPGNLAAACHDAGAALIHMSTDYVFDGLGDAPYTEDDPISPVSAYGESKAAGEAAVRARLERHVILRTAWVFSPIGRNFVRSIVAAAQAGKDLRVVDDQIGGPTDAEPLADGILSIATFLADGSGASGTYHLAGAPPVSRFDFACEIVSAVGTVRGDAPRVTPTTSVEYPTPARRPVRAILDCARVGQVYGLAQPDWRSSLPAVVGSCMEAEQ
jgi:dTDP-4-dehydrorhamnose reductase